MIKIEDKFDSFDLPPDLGDIESLEKEEEKIIISSEKRKFGKDVTIISNVTKGMNPERVLKSLKQKLACGGTYKDGRIELQGKHNDRAKKVLISLGFSEDQIEVK